MGRYSLGGLVIACAIGGATWLGPQVAEACSCAGTSSFLEPACTDPEATIEKARFTITGPDTTAPSAEDGVALAQEDGEFQVGCDDTTNDLRLRATIDVGDVEPNMWVEIEFTKSGEVISTRGHAIPANGVVETERPHAFAATTSFTPRVMS